MDFLISDDKNRLQIDRICNLLASTYWAKDRSRDAIEKCIEHSICFGVYKDGKQIGFARCVTDYATVYWLADVVIDNEFRGQGLGKALMEKVVSHERLNGLMGILATKDAHGLYEEYGFKSEDGKFMRRAAE